MHKLHKIHITNEKKYQLVVAFKEKGLAKKLNFMCKNLISSES